MSVMSDNGAYPTHKDKGSITSLDVPKPMKDVALVLLKLYMTHAHTRIPPWGPRVAVVVPYGGSLGLGGFEQHGDGGGRLVQEGLRAVVLLQRRGWGRGKERQWRERVKHGSLASMYAVDK